MVQNQPILSRHRLPRFYRVSLTLFWGMPALIFIITILGSHGEALAVIDPRFWIPILLMCVPAVYIWREGVDVLPDGIIARIFWPRYYAYSEMDTWYFDQRPQHRVLTVWDANHYKLLEYRAGHLTNLVDLLSTLKSHVRYRHWPK
jgi:hypothetical protein